METNQKSKSSFYTVPEDLICDILRVLFRYDVPFEIKGVTENQNALVLEIKIPADHKFVSQIKGNIESILNEYQSYLRGQGGYESVTID